MSLPVSILVALVGDSNDYQRAQARAAEDAAKSNRANVQIVFCNGDAVEQSQQVLQCVLSKSDASKVAGVVVQPVGTWPSSSGSGCCSGRDCLGHPSS